MSLPELRVSQLWIYPIKSLGGIRLSRTKVFPKGFEFDRRFMLIDESSSAITQRQHPMMALFETTILESQLEIRFQTDTREIALRPQFSGHEIKVNIWDDTASAFEPDEALSKWFSGKLGIPCRLVFFPESHARPVDQRYQIKNEHVSLADGYPVLMIGQASLDDLNSRLDVPVPMNRFRPNMVFEGGAAFCEDGWREFAIGQNRFAAVKPCARCILTTIDQKTGQKGSEPLRTLASYRSKNNKVMFGQNVLVLEGSSISEGDSISVSLNKAEPTLP